MSLRLLYRMDLLILIRPLHDHYPIPPFCPIVHHILSCPSSNHTAKRSFAGQQHPSPSTCGRRMRKRTERSPSAETPMAISCCSSPKSLLPSLPLRGRGRGGDGAAPSRICWKGRELVVVRASMVDSFESSASFAKRMERAWLISQVSSPSFRSRSWL